jgi:hypothetical protein
VRSETLLTLITSDEPDAAAMRSRPAETARPRLVLLRSPTTKQTADNVVEIARVRRRSIESFEPQGGDAA